MKVLLLAFFVAAVAAVPMPDEDGGPVEVIVNGVPEGHALEIDDLVAIHLNEQAGGEVVAATNLLHPFTAVGIAEAAAIDNVVAEPVEAIPEPVALPSPAMPEVIPEAVVLPSPAAPEVVPEAVVLPSPAAPEVIPEAVVLPSPATPEVTPEAVVLPSPAAPEVTPEAVVLPSPAAPEVTPEAVVLPSPAAPEIIPEAEIVPESVALPAPETPEVVPEALILSPNVVPEVAEAVEETGASAVVNGEIYNDGVVQVTVNAPQEEAGFFSSIQSWFSMALNYIQNGVQVTQHII